MGKVIDFPDQNLDGENGGRRKIRIAGGAVLDFQPELIGTRQEVEDPNSLACWFHTHLGVIHQSELALFDEVQVLADKLLQALIKEGGERQPLVTAKTGFLRELGVFLLARGRKGELGAGVCEGAARFGKRLFPQEFIDGIRCKAVRSLYGTPPRQDRMPSILEVLDHFMPRV